MLGYPLPQLLGDMEGGTRGVCVYLGSMQQPEFECVPWGHCVTPRDIIAVQDISRADDHHPVGHCHPVEHHHPKRHSHRMEHCHPMGHCHPVGHNHLWELSLYKASAPCGASLHSAASSPFEAGIVAHRTLSSCASPCARCQLSAPPTCSACAETRWLSVALPTWGQEPLLPLLPAWGHGHLLALQGPAHSPLPGDRILEYLHGNKLICA